MRKAFLVLLLYLIARFSCLLLGISDVLSWHWTSLYLLAETLYMSHLRPISLCKREECETAPSRAWSWTLRLGLPLRVSIWLTSKVWSITFFCLLMENNFVWRFLGAGSCLEGLLALWMLRVLGEVESRKTVWWAVPRSWRLAGVLGPSESRAASSRAN